jgi:hypothetical protein
LSSGYNGKMKLFAAIQDVGFEKTRRAVAALSLSFFLTLYVMLSFNAPEGWGPAFLALAACYLVAFLGVTAEWFWGRWFASGLGWSGLMVAGVSMVMLGWLWPLAIYGGLHGLVVLLLLGKRMSVFYDLQEGWRQRFGMDEFGVARLRKTVTRTAASLPSVILWALGPKDPGQGMGHLLFSVGLGALAIVGLTALLRMRTWGLIAIGSAAAGLMVHSGLHARLPEFRGAIPFLTEITTARTLGGLPGLVTLLTLTSAVAGAALLVAVAPFLRPMARHLRSR